MWGCYVYICKNWGQWYFDGIFESLGWVAAIATSSPLTEMAKGKTLEDALTISNKDVANKLDGLLPFKMLYFLLAEEGLKFAAEDYHKNNS